MSSTLSISQKRLSYNLHWDPLLLHVHYGCCPNCVPSDHWQYLSKPVSIIFDGTSRLGEALVIVLRFLDNWEIKQRLVQLQILVKSITGEELAREILGVLCREFKLSTEQVLAAMRDRASVNNVAIRHIKVMFPNLLDIGCYSHTLDLVGSKFELPTLEEFIRPWIFP